MAFFSGDFPLVTTLQNFRKCAMRGVLAKFAIARLYGNFGSRRLQQNFVLGLHVKSIVYTR